MCFSQHHTPPNFKTLHALSPLSGKFQSHCSPNQLLLVSYVSYGKRGDSLPHLDIRTPCIPPSPWAPTPVCGSFLLSCVPSSCCEIHDPETRAYLSTWHSGVRKGPRTAGRLSPRDKDTKREERVHPHQFPLHLSHLQLVEQTQLKTGNVMREVLLLAY